MTPLLRLRASPLRLRRAAVAAIVAAAGVAGVDASAAPADPAPAASTARSASAITFITPASATAAQGAITTTTTTTTVTTAPPTAAPAAAAPPADELALEPFPNAIDVGHTPVATEQGVLPIGPPDRSIDSNDRISPVGLPYRGRVRLFEYRHGADESPRLIERHYTDQLKALGFTVLVVCEAPCRTAGGLEDESAYWARELDPQHRLGARAFGDRGAYVIGYKPGAVVAVRIGTWDLDFGSAIKIIQSDGLDLGPLELYARQQHPNTAAIAPAAAATAPHGVQVVPPGAVADAIGHGDGLVVVQLTALDKGCASCAKASAAFDALAADGAGARFLRVAYPTRAAVAGDAFARAQHVTGVPFFLTFRGGEVVRREGGPADVATLRAKLVDGVE